ncbi:MAG: hypothetical protein GQ570_09655 [Helicobacteraceae bacterium]|nr:hypothetical protein [Helicobacteraceae bacterium]
MLIETLVEEAIKTVNKEQKIPELMHLNNSTPLFELLDSLGTLDLILELEDRLQSETNNYIAIADEFSMDSDKTPFKTLSSLKKFVQEKLDG